MAVHRIRKGLDLPITGSPEQKIHQGPTIPTLALLAADYIGMKPTMFIKEGDSVLRGQALFEDKKNPGVIYTAPGAGNVLAINRGERRALQSVVIALNAREQSNSITKRDRCEFKSYTGDDPAALNRDQVKELLIESGLWTAFRTRPFSRVPSPDSEPGALFITAMDTNPLAPSVEEVLQGREHLLNAGLLCLSKLREGRIYLCKAKGSQISAEPYSGIRIEEFQGKHPAGTVGVHIHRLDPAHRGKTVWHINYQDVIAIGQLFTTGLLEVDRVISLAGPMVKQPRLIRTRIGAATASIVDGELDDGEQRVISGSVLSGRTAQGDVLGYLGRYHQQISVIAEGREREFFGWMSPGADKFSLINTFISRLNPAKRFSFTTSTNGSPRAMVPIGLFERVMPMDIMPTFLLRALVMGDLERAEHLGCLELDEEDLALCTFVCPGKCDYGPYLRDVLTRLEHEG